MNAPDPVGQLRNFDVEALLSYAVVSDDDPPGDFERLLLVLAGIGKALDDTYMELNSLRHDLREREGLQA